MTNADNLIADAFLSEPLSISMQEAAKIVGVSAATIRNWIKTGYLVSLHKGRITKDSLDSFMAETMGKEKLNSRANKREKDRHNHTALTWDTGQKVRLTTENGDDLARSYENSLSESHRNKEGIYYTPLNIIDDMLSSIPSDIGDSLFLDPCCGSGNFILSAIKLGFKPQNVYGFDTDENAIALTKKRIYDHSGFQSTTIVQGDFLKIAKKETFKFDFIFTNPPWGKKMPADDKENYAQLYETGNSTDTSALFFFASLACLSATGKLGFLLQEAFFNIATFQDARKAALNLSIERLIDYGKPFKGLLTKAQAIILSNVPVENALVNCELSTASHSRSLQSFRATPKTILNFWADEAAAEIISHVYATNHLTLTSNISWGLGIVTGNNAKYCQTQPQEGFIPVYKGPDIRKTGLEMPTAFIPKTLNLYQQVAPKELYEAPEKLIYKFISPKLCFYLDTEQKYLLNSANFLVPNSDFPLTGKQLTDLLNSTFINWLYQKIFYTPKVLRGDLARLPIHNTYFNSC
ncbi:MAG: Modification methylase VspI, partial [Bacteroidota bacterium]